MRHPVLWYYHLKWVSYIAWNDISMLQSSICQNIAKVFTHISSWNIERVWFWFSPCFFRFWLVHSLAFFKCNFLLVPGLLVLLYHKMLEIGCIAIHDYLLLSFSFFFPFFKKFFVLFPFSFFFIFFFLFWVVIHNYFSLSLSLFFPFLFFVLVSFFLFLFSLFPFSFFHSFFLFFFVFAFWNFMSPYILSLLLFIFPVLILVKSPNFIQYFDTPPQSISLSICFLS